MSITLNEAEVACLKKLSEMHESGEIYFDQLRMSFDSITLNPSNSIPILRMLEQYKYIENVSHTSAGWFTLFTISPSAVQAVRELELERKKLENQNILEKAKTWAMKHPFWGRVLLVASVVIVVITVANQLLSLLKGLGIL